MNGIRVTGLVKRYPRTNDLWQLLRAPFARTRTTALDGIDLEITRGSIHALLGPNGAGKTTLLKVLAGLMLADAGTISVDGVDCTDLPRKLRDAVSLVVSDERSFYWRLSIYENLRFFATLQGLHGTAREARIDACLVAVGLDDRAGARFQVLSTGMRQRLAIARGLLVEPSILLMDEPTRSLDPESASLVHDIVAGIVHDDRERVVVYSTHNLTEAESIADRVVVLREGRVAAEHSLAERSTDGPHSYRLRTHPAVEPDVIGDDMGVTVVATRDDSLSLQVATLADLDDLIDRLRSQDIRIIELVREQSALRELYLDSGRSAP